MNTVSNTTSTQRPRSLGFTLIELMIAITISIFLVGGLLVMVQSTRGAFGNQNALAQLQDNERLVMTFMAEVIESAGYYPNPAATQGSLALPVSGVFATAGQGVFGTTQAAIPNDTVTIRYAAASPDNIFNCRGGTNTSGATDVIISKFYIDNVTIPGTSRLVCKVSSAVINPAQVVPLVNGVSNLQILYGIRRSTSDTGTCTDTYAAAGAMTNADWANVCAVQIKVTFVNPIKGPGSAATISITRTIAVMNAAGVNS